MRCPKDEASLQAIGIHGSVNFETSVGLEVVGGSGPNTQPRRNWVSRLRRAAWGYRASPKPEATTITRTRFPKRSNLKPGGRGGGCLSQLTAGREANLT